MAAILVQCKLCNGEPHRFEVQTPVDNRTYLKEAMGCVDQIRREHDDLYVLDHPRGQPDWLIGYEGPDFRGAPLMAGPTDALPWGEPER